NVNYSLIIPFSKWRYNLVLRRRVMPIRISLNIYVRAAVALLAVCSDANTAFGQKEKEIDLWIAAPSDLTLAPMAVEQVPEPDSALTSVEQGKPNLDQAFDEFNQWRLEKRRAALEDTQFLVNLRTFYF